MVRSPYLTPQPRNLPAIVNGNITGSLLEVFRSLSHQITSYLSHVSWYLTYTSTHLLAFQKPCVLVFSYGLRSRTLITAEAKEQQIRTPESVLANFPEQNPVYTRDELATMSGVSAYRNFVHFYSAYSME